VTWREVASIALLTAPIAATFSLCFVNCIICFL